MKRLIVFMTLALSVCTVASADPFLRDKNGAFYYYGEDGNTDLQSICFMVDPEMSFTQWKRGLEKNEITFDNKAHKLTGMQLRGEAIVLALQTAEFRWQMPVFACGAWQNSELFAKKVARTLGVSSSREIKVLGVGGTKVPESVIKIMRERAHQDAMVDLESRCASQVNDGETLDSIDLRGEEKSARDASSAVAFAETLTIKATCRIKQSN